MSDSKDEPIGNHQPPSYTEATDSTKTDPDGPQCDDVIAHLKLLFAFYQLRESVLNDTTALGIDDTWLMQAGSECTEEVLSARRLIAEKRWDVFVQKAAFRFETWWSILKQRIGSKPITIGDLLSSHPPSIGNDEKAEKRAIFPDALPPLDVLMVWHSFLLSPRKYLEDCLLQGMLPLWHTKFPWLEIDQCMGANSTKGEYNPGNEAIKSFQSWRPWNNVEDECTRSFTCPNCSSIVADVPCTTFPDGLRNLQSIYSNRNLSNAALTREISSQLAISSGWADAGFTITCGGCGKQINRDVLCAGKFAKDVMTYSGVTGAPSDSSSPFLSSMKTRRPLPSTLLDPRSGLLQAITLATSADLVTKREYFPNVLAAAMSNIDSAGTSLHTPSWTYTMVGVRGFIETALSCRERMLWATSKRQRRANKHQRPTVRKMMACYNENPFMFTLDLASAVHRQAKFVHKMQHIDWLHSPALSLTAARIVEKYRRFLVVIASNPKQMSVPTLDVDLAWHTNQLSPSYYFRNSVRKTGRFIDHDDKVSEHKLSEAFATTSKNYQRLFNEPYSECTCWYCEAMHASVAKFPGRFLLPNSARGYRRPEDTHEGSATAHISTHNAVRLTNPPLEYKNKLTSHLAWLDKAYDRACERAKRDGRQPPVRRHPQASATHYDSRNPAYYDGMSLGGYGMSGKAAGGALLVGGALAVGVVAIAVTADGDLAFDGPPEHVDNMGAGGCVGSACGGGVGWGGCADDSGGTTGACGGNGGSCNSSCGGGCGGGCGGCGG